MADTTTELEVLDQIVDVLGGQSGQYETVVPVLRQIKELLGGGGGGGGYNPALSVGRADALTGADSTAQWAQRVSTGSGAATVRSVQGAAEVQNDELVPVRIAGIRSMTAQGGELDSVEWPTQTLRAAGSVADMLYSDHVDVRVGVVDLGAMEWSALAASGSAGYVMINPINKGINDALPPQSNSYVAQIKCALYNTESATNAYLGNVGIGFGSDKRVYVYDTNYNQQDSPAAFKAAMQGVLLFYALATPTTQPIDPILDMTYRVQAGGSESVIVPAGEISAAPVLTIAEGESAAEVVMDALACIATPDGPTATANHALNTYLTMGGKLYKVTSAIAVGESIAAGTNVTQTTVMAELIARTA